MFSQGGSESEFQRMTGRQLSYVFRPRTVNPELGGGGDGGVGVGYHLK